MQSINQPAKFLVPFAQNDSAKVEIPATTSDPTRFSQSLGSPPLTGMPPEAGGVPPQLEDFNGAIYQQSRVAWWNMSGNRFGYDSTWANDALISGYARGAVLPAAIGAGLIGMGEWYNNTESNVANPDTDGTGWVPGYHYGATALTGQTGGTVTLSPAQAGKRVITVAGTLTSNLVLVVPGWIYDWTVYNTTGGAFTVTVKNAATSGVVIPQNGAPTPVHCDGTACTLLAANIAPATSDGQAMQYGQAGGRLLNTQVFTASGTYTPTAGTRSVIVAAVGGGGAGGSCPSTSASQQATAAGGESGGFIVGRFTTVPATVAVTIGAAGAIAAVGANKGGDGGNTTFGALLTAPGGVGGGGGVASAALLGLGFSQVSTTEPSVTGGTILESQRGATGTGPIVLNLSVILSGQGGASPWGRGGAGATTNRGLPATGFGSGGGGCSQGPSSAGDQGGTATAGRLVVYEYA